MGEEGRGRQKEQNKGEKREKKKRRGEKEYEYIDLGTDLGASRQWVEVHLWRQDKVCGAACWGVQEKSVLKYLSMWTLTPLPTEKCLPKVHLVTRSWSPLPH